MTPAQNTNVDGEFGVRWTPLVSDLPREHGYEPLEIEGRLPADLAGTLYRVGPGLFSSFGRRYGHLFDGDGAISAVRFSGGKAFGAARVIQGAELRRERAAGKSLYFSFGTHPAGFPRSLLPKNVANTSVMRWNDRLLALFEARLPTELRDDKEDLSTVGETNLSGVLGKTFSAHPHYCLSRKAFYNFGLKILPWGSKVDLFELSDAGCARKLASVPLPGAVFLHDFIVTERHAVFFGSPTRLDLLNVIYRRRPLAQSLAWKPELGTTVLVVPLDEPARWTRFSAEPFFNFHFVNAFERGRQIVVDFVRYPDLARPIGLAAELLTGRLSADSASKLCRGVIDLDRRSLSCEQRWDRTCEFPIVGPKGLTVDHRFVYLVAMSPDPASVHSYATRLAKVDMRTGKVAETTLGRECYPSEALFVPRPGGNEEDDGYLVSLVYDADRGATCAAVLDARDLEAGVIARAWFDHSLPLTFHGTWA